MGLRWRKFKRKFELSLDDKTKVLLALFIAAIVAANLLGTKITILFGISVSVGIFSYPLTFLITDMIEEVHGKRKTRIFVYAGFLAILLVLLLTYISVILPPASRYDFNEQYTIIFNPALRMMIASIIAFLVAQFHDLWAFNMWKQKTKGKLLWFRNTASTIVSQFLDTSLFMFIAFYQVTPKFTAGFVFALILPYWLLKVFMAVCDTPFCYLGVRWLRRSKR